MHLTTVEIVALHEIQGVPFPSGVLFRDILITGPLGSGKTTLVETIRGWPGEGYVDLTKKNWWRDRLLTFRPREVHFGIPFIGHDAVIDGGWPLSPIDLKRIRMPAAKKRFFNIDWGTKLVFDVQLPPPERIYEIRNARAKKGSHRLDAGMTLENVRCEVAAYQALALNFHRNGLNVYIRDTFQGPPKRIIDQEA